MDCYEIPGSSKQTICGEPVLLDTSGQNGRRLTGRGIRHTLIHYDDGRIGIAVRVGTYGWMIFDYPGAAEWLSEEMHDAYGAAHDAITGP